MKRQHLALCLILACAPGFAGQFDDFNSRVRADLVKPFALDLGGILGGAANPSGKPLGFPGFSVGVTGAAQFRPDKNNLILRNSGVKAFGLPFLEVGVGLPLGIGVVAHGTKVGDIKVFGGGVKYTVFKSGTVTMAVPSIQLSGFYDMVDHKFFNARHFAANAAAVWNEIPVAHPFVAAGLDSTRVKVEDNALTASARGVSQTATGSRLAVGLDLSPLPLFHVNAAYALNHGIPGADFGITFAF